ncbi:MAG: SUMF1/EgtB/PvdO family nonheme iron enzyme [Pleurocapsa sp. MO_226.B13]|nr:SUMF1/EgtB/PvdO family nonheme iron enzyme [Pleurocapsa sp. MO_226.B13]
MKLSSIPSRRQSIARELQRVRQNTLDLLSEVNDSFIYTQAHPDFSPIGWHLGHIAFTEAYWILERLANLSPSFPQDRQYHRLFAADGLPKKERQNLPQIEVIQDYLASVRIKVLEYLKSAPIEQQERLWRWLIQHESQHGETMTLIWQLHRQRNNQHFSVDFSQLESSLDPEIKLGEMVEIPAGEFVMGSNSLEAQDNESPAHRVHLDTYWLDRHPVTCGQYYQFMAAGGYQKRQYWSDSGWQWLQEYPVAQPLYWSDSTDWVDHPVCGVSYFEAEAYANFVQKRLPTEAEWEKAALGASTKCNHDRLIGHTSPVNAYPDLSKYGCQDMLGNVWEWTASWFAGYREFASHPYPGYSEVYFDRQHRVLRGGSWATNRSSLRTSFRNWYYPQVRQILAGFRCARDC